MPLRRAIPAAREGDRLSGPFIPPFFTGSLHDALLVPEEPTFLPYG
jgi:hypothetical protein